MKPQQTPGIAQHQQCAEVMQHRGDHRAGGPQPAKRRRRDNRQGPAQADDHIDLQSMPALTAQAHAGAQPTQIAADQHDIR